MSDPITFTSTTPRYGLPYLFAGQAQKELFVNEALALADTLLHPVVEGEADAPPVAPEDGECWLVGAAASGAWAGEAGKLAAYQAGGWVFVTPRDGLRVLDRSSGQDVRFVGSWRRASAPPIPEGGAIVDSEARAAIAELVDILITGGILPAS